MSTLRKGKCYTNITRSYTRKSKFKKKGFIKAIPTNKIVRYDMGDSKKSFPYKVQLVSREDIQLRHNSIESARLVVNRAIQERLGNNYHLQLHLYPHHILRENKMLSGAHADRLQTGMAHSFGKAVGLAAQVKKGKTIFTASVAKEHIDIAREALHKATPRLPGRYSIEVTAS